MAIPALLFTDETPATSPNLAKKKPKWFSVMYKGTPWKVTFVFVILIYSVCNLTYIVVSVLPPRDLMCLQSPALRTT